MFPAVTAIEDEDEPWVFVNKVLDSFYPDL